jgi:hypothetical protein
MATTEYLVPISESTIVSSTGSALGSWVTGDFFASTGASAAPATFHGASIFSFAADVFSVSGTVTVSSGTSAVVTFGATGVSGTATGLGVAGYSSSGDMIQLKIIDGTSNETSVACLGFDLYVGDACLPDGYGLLGLGVLTPVSLTVNNGDTLELDVTVEAFAGANANTSDQTANAEITVDPLYLAGDITFNSGITGFLSGPPSGPPSSVPEPASFVLLGTGFIALGFVRRRKRKPA